MQPSKGGSWTRDPKTGALTRNHVAETVSTPATHTAPEETAVEPARPAAAKKGK